MEQLGPSSGGQWSCKVVNLKKTNGWSVNSVVWERRRLWMTWKYWKCEKDEENQMRRESGAPGSNDDVIYYFPTNHIFLSGYALIRGVHSSRGTNAVRMMHNLPFYFIYWVIYYYFYFYHTVFIFFFEFVKEYLNYTLQNKV